MTCHWYEVHSSSSCLGLSSFSKVHFTLPFCFSGINQHWLSQFKGLVIYVLSVPLKGTGWCSEACPFSPEITVNKKASIYRRAPPMDTPNPCLTPFHPSPITVPELLELFSLQLSLIFVSYQLRYRDFLLLCTTLLFFPPILLKEGESILWPLNLVDERGKRFPGLL